MADPAYGTKSWTVIDLENGWATDKGTVGGFKLAVLRNTLHPEKALVSDESLRSDFNRNDSADGDETATGTIEFIPSVDHLPYIFKWMFGNLSTTGSADPYVHVSKISTNGPNSCVIETKQDIGGTARYYKTSGARINRLSFGTTATGFLKLSLDIIGQKTVMNTSVYSGAVTDWTSTGTRLDALKIAAADTKLGGSAVTYIGDVNFEINANLDTSDRRVGQGAYLQSLIAGPHAVTGSLNCVLSSTAAATFIDTGGFSSVDLVYTATASTRLFQLLIARIKAMRNGPTIEGPGLTRVGVRYEGSYDSTAVSSVVATITNANAGTVYI